MLTFTLPSDVLSMKPNILIDQDGHARLTDFGLSESTNHMNPTRIGPFLEAVRWASPELLNLTGGDPTEASDCYSLGMVIYEVLSGQQPFASYPSLVAMRKITIGERPERPEGVEGMWITNDLWEMLCSCWSGDSQSRPSVKAVLKCLEQVSSTWKPPSPQANEDVEKDENDWDLSILKR
jgi:serine/threonine protein kinase